MESCQKLGKKLRKTNYLSEIHQVKPVYARKPPNQLATQINCMISIKPNPILEIFRARRHQSPSDLKINSYNEIVDGNINGSIKKPFPGITTSYSF